MNIKKKEGRGEEEKRLHKLLVSARLLLATAHEWFVHRPVSSSCAQAGRELVALGPCRGLSDAARPRDRHLSRDSGGETFPRGENTSSFTTSFPPTGHRLFRNDVAGGRGKGAQRFPFFFLNRKTHDAPLAVVSRGGKKGQVYSSLLPLAVSGNDGTQNGGVLRGSFGARTRHSRACCAREHLH